MKLRVLFEPTQQRRSVAHRAPGPAASIARGSCGEKLTRSSSMAGVSMDGGKNVSPVQDKGGEKRAEGRRR